MSALPADSALLVVDMQNAFCSAGGSLAKRGVLLKNLPATIKRIKKVLSIFRKEELNIVFSKLVLPLEAGGGGMLLKKFPAIASFGGYAPGSWDSEIIPALEPKRTEQIFTKTTYDSFLGTRLSGILNKHKSKRVYVCGVLSNVCVEAAVIGLFCRGYEPYLLTDCTTTYSLRMQDKTISNVKRHFGWATTSAAIPDKLSGREGSLHGTR